jgi:uncharacterized protein DUF2877
VLARLAVGPGRATLRAGTSAAYLELGGVRGRPGRAGDAVALPNGIALAGAPPVAGGAAALAPGRVEVDGWAARWDDRRPPVWTGVVLVPAADAEDLAARGEDILRGALGAASPRPAALAQGLAGGGVGPTIAGLGLLLDALAARDPVLARRAGQELTGRGAGLTPEGDDLLAGVAATVAAAGAVAGLDERERAAWSTALLGHALAFGVGVAAALFGGRRYGERSGAPARYAPTEVRSHRSACSPAAPGRGQPKRT